jgi:cytochrome c oxidase subunit 1/cytochrome c oxidase subunit I+III
MGWDALNLLSTIGGFLLAAGIFVIIANVLWSLCWGPTAGDDPWDGNTLEWATTSPPPHYNFPVIPVVRSADPNWDREDRAEDERRLEQGELVLADGHETVSTGEVDAELERVLRMPSDSPWPLALALSLTVFFVGLIASSNVTAWVGVGLVLVSLAAWHYPWTPHEEELA